MNYKVLSRPKLPRNKYGEVENKDMIGGGGNSYFSSTSNQGSGGSTAEYSEFVGATNTLDGKKGLVPAPKTNNDEPLITNDKDKFLKGSGAWTDIPISRYTSENTNKDGIDLDGNLTISDTLTTQTLNVLGSAHFWELVIDKVKAAGGNLLITPANFTIDYIGSDVTYNVDATQSPFTEMFFSANDETGILGLQELFTANNVTSLKAKRLYQKNTDGSTQIASEFVIGDMIRCKTLNIDENSGFTNKDYWTFILATGTETYNSESCMYIDVLYQYVANGTTYGLGTTISLPSNNNTRSLKSTKSVSATRSTSTTTPEEVYGISDLTQYQFNPYSKLYLAANPSWGNSEITVSGSLSFSGYPDFDGVTWIIGNQTFEDGDSYTSIVNGHTLSITCYIDSRIDAQYPVVCFDDVDGVGLNNLLSGMGAFWVEQGAAPTPDPVADPVISYANNTITITCSTSGATIYYKLDSGSFTQYSSPITINADTVVQAYATKDGVDSNTVSQTCIYVNPTPETVADPVISFANNTITITCSTSGATIFYKLNSGSYVQYSSPILISSTTIVSAYATKDDIESNKVNQTCVYVEPSPSNITEFKFGYGTFNPEIGDNLVSLGHLWEADRQGAILISSYDPMDTELKAPAIAQYEGINKFTSLSPFRTTSMAANGNSFEGKFLVNYNGNYIDINERLNIFNADLTTGLEKVGIHLDGDNSTIKMVGSVEIKQNSDGIPDTLTVWDDDDIMRVKISPEQIPNLSNIQTSINPTSKKSFNTLTGDSTPTSGNVYSQHSYKYFLWAQWDHQWKYWLDNAYFSYISTMEIGSFTAGQKITVSNLQTNISSKAFFKNSDYVSTRTESLHTQSISDVILRLKMYNGSSWITFQTYNLTNTATKTCNDENATVLYPSTIINNYNIPTTGTYRLELEVVHIVYATITYTTEQTSPYFDFDYSVRSTIDLVQPSASMTRVGRNGLVFNTDSAGQYFYAGNDGIEMKWGDASITLNGTSGFKTTYPITNITSSSSKYIPSSASIVVASTLSSATTIYLPDSSTYGVGRIMTIIGNDYITISTYSSSENIYKSISSPEKSTAYYTPVAAKTNCFSSIRTLPMSSSYSVVETDGENNYDRYYRTHEPIVRLMCNGAGWYKI